MKIKSMNDKTESVDSESESDVIIVEPIDYVLTKTTGHHNDEVTGDNQNSSDEISEWNIN